MDDFVPLNLSDSADRFSFCVVIWLWMYEVPDPSRFCICALDPESPACRRKRMQGRRLRRQAQPHAPLRRPIGARAAHVTGARAGPSSGGNADDGGGEPPPLRRRNEFDCAYYFRTAAIIARAIRDATTADGPIPIIPITETADALIAALAFVLAASNERRDGLVAAVAERLHDHLAAADRREAGMPKGGRA